MARRDAQSAAPAYIPHNAGAGGRRLQDPDESAFSRFLRTEVWAPEKLPGNISIVTAVGVFAAGIFAVRTWGDLMIVA
ncbi:hypothetical protein AX16_009475 [Volvariella volvacea WC 439]|nr:hypothetical protein AX16_009475 [Volvariella volvacea WC 439]